MPIKWAEAECRCMRNLARLSVAIGGFLIVTSLVLTGIIFLILMNIIEIDVFADQQDLRIESSRKNSLSLLFMIYTKKS